ncbi:lecithin retinol acyltransferase family protein [Shewanella cyperi]|uniref:lecithin retinol acyltransferase family protein n=1 Tax=Shewanella cyperi TaxID=2814292 RepID=UPI001A947B5B|nr:lecithin retinol acyltransferase family protein [Shewanella cyperi]QSX39494.1 hypothetical protein JYB84_10615 [Shewanella cyperi]
MALPLIWLGGAALGALALAEREHRRKLLLERSLGRSAREPSEATTVLAPSVWQFDGPSVRPVPGAIVCCHVYGLVEHTGIWLGDSIAELHGSGLIRAVSAKRFLHGRTGSRIFVACDHDNQPLATQACADRASEALFQFRDYDLFANNCHRFVWQCLSGEDREVKSFEAFNQLLASFYSRALYWDPVPV